jgi:hypothetical protein
MHFVEPTSWWPVSTRACHWTILQARWIPSTPFFLKPILILTFHLWLGLPRGYFPLHFWNKFFMHVLHLHQSHISWFDHPWLLTSIIFFFGGWGYVLSVLRVQIIKLSIKLYMFWGSQVRNCSECGCLGCDTVTSCMCILTFSRNTLPLVVLNDYLPHNVPL